MSKPKLKFQPSVYVARDPCETSQAFTARVLRNMSLLPDQRESLMQDSNDAFADCVKGIWIEQAPISLPGVDQHD